MGKLPARFRVHQAITFRRPIDSADLFISYWRCNYTKVIRIMRHRENESPEVVEELALAGSELTDADAELAEARLVLVTPRP